MAYVMSGPNLQWGACRGFWHINAVVINSSLPHGPTSLDELFDWPWRYAQQLLVHHEKKNTFRATFAENSKYNINVTESYAGMGTGSYTLHHQFNALKGRSSHTYMHACIHTTYTDKCIVAHVSKQMFHHFVFVCTVSSTAS